MTAEARRGEIIELLRTQGSVSVAQVQERLGVSLMTARRDLAELDRRGVAVRTHGGAVLPNIAAHEDSFSTRLSAETDAKDAIAAAAAAELAPGDSVFLDSSTTCFFVARHILELGIELTLVTNSLAIMQLVTTQAAAHINLIGAGGLLRPLTQSFVGPDAVRTVSGHFCDHAFLSVKALSTSGMLADADALEAEVKRVMIAQAREPILLVSASKLSARGLNAIGPLTDISAVLAYGASEADLKPLRAFDVPVRLIGAPPGERSSAASTPV